MNTTQAFYDSNTSGLDSAIDVGRDSRTGVIDLFTETDNDYGEWSKCFNMHFGYYELGMNPCDREAMLERMNAKVIARLALPPSQDGSVVDLGCGTGATARALLRAHPGFKVSGVTVVPAQIARGRALNIAAGIAPAMEFVQRDFTSTGLASDSYDGAYAVESACYAQGPDKLALLAEAYRLLKPGARLVIADGLRKHGKPLNRLTDAIYREFCASWALPELAQVPAMRDGLQAVGFINIEFTEVSWHVAPSVAHVPYVATRYLLLRLMERNLSQLRRGHALASVAAILLGLDRDNFGHYLVSARKPPLTPDNLRRSNP